MTGAGAEADTILPIVDDALLARWTAEAAGLDTQSLVAAAICGEFAGRIAVVSSFGPESAVLLHLCAMADPAVPVIFVDTGKLFPETLAYRDALVAQIGLTDVRTVRAEPAALAQRDGAGDLWKRSSDACCALRKVEPFAAALSRFDAWISGRKRFHGAERTDLPLVERRGSHLKFNPLAAWSAADLVDYARRQGLPPHPLLAKGYGSVGCTHCTTPLAPGEASRAGRWRGTDKTECGIHFVDGVLRRAAPPAPSAPALDRHKCDRAADGVLATAR